MSKDPQVYLAHILESIQEVEGFLAGLSEAAFLASTEKQAAVTWKLVTIGESVAQIPDDFKAAHPAVPWATIKAGRNILIHEYFRLDVGEVWQMASRDLPELKRLLQPLLG